MDNSTYSFFEKFNNDNFCLLYDGNIVDEVTDKIIGLSESNFEQQEDYTQSRRKFSFLLAECFQNIIRHGDITDTNESKRSFGFFLTRNLQGSYFITSGNLIKNENVAGLKAQLNQVNSLDKEGLKNMYLEVLSNRHFSQKGGAGLGLIEIARKSGQKIEYIFDDFDTEFSIFYNQVMLKPPKQIPEPSGYHIVEAMQLHRAMMAENIIMIQKGDFSNSSIFPVLEILQSNMSDFFQQSHQRKEVYHVLIELLQNIGRYGAEQNERKEGIFVIGKRDNRFVLSAGNYVKENQKQTLTSQIDFLNNLSKKEIKSRYLESLKEENQGVQIELLEIARRSDGEIQYDFKKLTEKMYFFTILVVV